MFRSNINILLEKKKMNTQELAQRAGMSRQALFKARQDQGISECRLSTLGRIAQALDVPVKELFDGEWEAGTREEK